MGIVPHLRNSSARRLPKKAESKAFQASAGLAALAVSYLFVWYGFRVLLAEAMNILLSSARISVTRIFSSDLPVLIVRLMDGSDLNLPLTWQRSGLVSILVFGLLFLLLMHPLKGSVWRKIAWLELGFIMGLTWSLIRLSTAVLFSYYLGAAAFTLAEFLMGPLADILWVITVWSLMLSTSATKKVG